jgi:hypothetical protein
MKLVVVRYLKILPLHTITMCFQRHEKMQLKIQRIPEKWKEHLLIGVSQNIGLVCVTNGTQKNGRSRNKILLIGERQVFVFTIDMVPQTAIQSVEKWYKFILILNIICD